MLSFHTNAYIGDGALVTSTGDLTVNAAAPLGLQNITLAGGLSTGGTAVGGAIAVNVLTVQTLAYIGAGSATYANATGALAVTASSHIAPVVPDPKVTKITIPALSSIALGGSAGGGDAAVTGSIIVDVLTIDTEATIADNVHVNDLLNGGTHGDTGQSVTVSATDDTHLINIAGAIALTEGDAGVGVGIIVDVINKDVKASIGDGADVWGGGDVKVDAIATLKLFELSVEAAVSTSGAGVAGGFIVVVDSDGVVASIGDATVSGLGIEVKASDLADKLELYAGNISFGDSAGVGVATVVLVRNDTVDAHVATGAVLTAGADGITVSATQSENQILVAGAGAGGGDAGVAGSVVVDVLGNSTTATLDGTTTSGGTVAVSASDTTNDISVAGQLAIGGTAGVGVGVDVEVITKDTEATIAPFASVTTTGAGNATVGATSQESVVQVAAGLAVGGSAAVAVNAGVSVYSITTNATIGSHASVIADGSVGVTADEALQLDVVAGNIAVGGAAGVGVAASVPVITKNTSATIGDFATVTGAGNGGGVTVNDGSFTVLGQDTRFNGAHVSGDTIDLGYTDGFATGDEVIYDDGNKSGSTDNGTPIGNLTPGNVYFIIVVTDHSVKLADSVADAKADTPIHITPGSGESHRLVPTDSGTSHADSSPRFDPATDVSGNQINLPYTLSVSTGDQVVYGAGGGTPIGNLTDGATYYAIAMGGNSYELADTKCHATGLSADCGGSPGVVTPITLDKSQATGRSHSLVEQGKTPSSDASQEGPQTITPGSKTGFKGVAVSATNSDSIAAVGVSAAIGGTAGVGVSGTVNVITVNTNATIGKHAVVNDNAGAAAGPNVLVAAGNQYHEILAAASIAIGGSAGVGASVDVAILHLNANALIDDSATVRATNDIIVTSTQTDTIDSITVAGGGGTVGVSAAVNVIVIANHVYANTGTNATVAAGNNAVLLASDKTNFLGVTGGVAGGFVGVGAGVSVVLLGKDTEAFVGSGTSFTGDATGSDTIGGISDGTETDTSFGFGTIHGVAVQAVSSENVFGLVIAVGAGFVGVAVPVGVTLLTVKTEAYDGGAISSADGAVNISALDSFTSLTIAGGIGAGFVGIGAGVDIGIATTTTSARSSRTGRASTPAPRSTSTRSRRST